MALFKRGKAGKPGEWFYCLEHGTVEEGPECPGKDRFGPYPSREEAERALETVRERNLVWENDPRWQDPPAGSGPGEARDEAIGWEDEATDWPSKSPRGPAGTSHGPSTPAEPEATGTAEPRQGTEERGETGGGRPHRATGTDRDGPDTP